MDLTSHLLSDLPPPKSLLLLSLTKMIYDADTGNIETDMTGATSIYVKSVAWRDGVAIATIQMKVE